MGWSFSCDPRDDRAALIRELTTDPAHHNTLDFSARGNHLWTVKEYTKESGETARYICLFLLRGGGRGSGWGYKDITESMGPCETDCPVRFFDMVPEPPNDYGREWRDRVRAAVVAAASKRQRIARLAVGQTIDLVPGCKPPRVRIASVKPLRGYDDNGRLYRIRPRHIATAATEGAQSCLAI